MQVAVKPVKAKKIASEEVSNESNAATAKEIQVLEKFKPYIWCIQVYNSENFRHKDSRRIVQSVFSAIFMCSANLWMLPIIILGTWYLIETNAELEMIIVSFPLMLTTSQNILILIALTAKNRTVSKTIEQLHRVVNQRKLLKKIPLVLFDIFFPRELFDVSPSNLTHLFHSSHIKLMNRFNR